MREGLSYLRSTASFGLQACDFGLSRERTLLYLYLPIAA
jgi:hypothetical protein